MLSLVVLGGAWPGMVTVETIGRIRRAFWVDKKPIRQIVRELRISRQTVRKAIRGSSTEFCYERQVQPQPKLGAYVARLDAMLEANSKRPGRERLTAQRLYELLRAEGYEGAYDSVQRHVREWRRQQSQLGPVFIPLWFAPGEAYQFDWSHEVVVLGGVTTTVKVAHIRLCHSRMFLVRAYPRETQEMVFDAHERAFRLFGGACRRGIYDNMPTAVEAVFVGKERRFNRRFLAMCSHYLVEPVACTPAAGWEKGQVENQVGNARERLFTPRLHFANYAELNAWLEARCLAQARASAHPEQTDKTVWEVFEAERASLIAYRGPFDGFREVEVAVSKSSLVRASTTTATASRSRRRGAPRRCGFMPSALSSGAAARLSPSTAAALAAARPPTIPGIICRYWRASRGRCATAIRSATGSCRRRWHRSGAGSPGMTTAIASLSTS